MDQTSEEPGEPEQIDPVVQPTEGEADVPAPVEPSDEAEDERPASNPEETEVSPRSHTSS